MQKVGKELSEDEVLFLNRKKSSGMNCRSFVKQYVVDSNAPAGLKDAA